MSVRVKSYANPLSASVINQPEVVDSTTEQRTAIVDGYEYHFGPNEIKNFADEGVGAAVAAFKSGESADGIVEDSVPFDARS